MPDLLPRLAPMLAPARDDAAPLGVGAAALVETPSGPRPAAVLKPGALVRATDGAWRMVRGVARRRCQAGEGVVIAAGALGPGVPAHPLHVARGQALLLGEGVWPAAFLVDGAEIVPAVVEFESVAIETDAPAAIPVEGVACLGVAPAGRAMPSAALVRVRRAIAARTGRVLGALEGEGAIVGPGRVEGWVRDLACPGAPVLVVLRRDGAELAFGFADLPRPDLDMAGLGACGFFFDVMLPARGTHLLEVCRAEDGAKLPGGVVMLAGEAAMTDLPAPPEAVAGALAALSRARLRRGPAAPR